MWTTSAWQGRGRALTQIYPLGALHQTLLSAIADPSGLSYPGLPGGPEASLWLIRMIAKGKGGGRQHEASRH